MVCHRLLEVYIVDDVSSLVAPISDHTLATELSSYKLLVVALTLRPVLKFTDLFKAGSGAHEFEHIVDCKHTAHLGLEGRCFEARHNHQPLS